MTRFLGDLELRDFFFIGLQEHFTEDLRKLSEQLKWRLPEDYYKMRVNVNPSKPNLRASSKGIRGLIASLNISDMDLYQEASSLRSKEYWR